MFKKLLPRKSARRWLGSQTELELERHFEIERKLGKGSYAVVFAARRRDDRQLYALKVADIAALGPLEQADVVNEIRLLASLSHPNLTTFYEAFCDHGKLCIVQELVGGGDLSTLIRKRAQHSMHLTEAQVWSTFLQVALGLQYLHHNHVLHRDLKPKNLLVSEGGVVKLADLGISQVLDRVFTDTMIGTPHYMSPEMWRRQPYSYSADVWALGCILHELCTLKPLFLAPTDEETRQKVLSGAVPPLPARYSADLRSLVVGILQQHPAARPTIDDILQTAAAQQHLALLPDELRQRCISPALSSERPLARLLHPIKVPQQASEWEQLNDLMPAPRYPSGSGVSSALRSKSKRGSWSTGDLQALAAEVDAELGSSGSGPVACALGSPSPSGGSGLGLAAPPPPPAAAAAAAMRKVQSHGGLSAAVEAHIERSSTSLTRRRTLGVGETLPLLAAEGRRRSGGSGSSGGAGTGGGASSRRNASVQLGTVAEEAGSGSGSPGPVGAVAGGLPARGSRGAAATARSKSLSVEDALEVLASGGPLPGAPGEHAFKRGQGAPAPDASLTARAPPAAAPPAPVASKAAAAGPAASAPTALPAAVQAPAAAQPRMPQLRAPLASPPVTAAVHLGAGSAGGKPPTEAAAVQEASPIASQQGQLATAGDGSEKRAAGKKAHFWQRGKSAR